MYPRRSSAIDVDKKLMDSQDTYYVSYLYNTHFEIHWYWQFNFDLISCPFDLQWAAGRGVYMKCPILMAPISQSVPVVFVNEKMSIIYRDCGLEWLK